MRKRDDTIDIMRGIAIFTMVASNLTPYALVGASPYWFRFYSTFAAPLFVFLAGMMIKLTEPYRQHSFWYYLIRGVALMAVGAAIGIFWWQNQPVERFARSGYPELFYPPTLSFFVVAAGVIMLLFYLVDHTETNQLYMPLKLYGKCSLLMYILHSVIIGMYFWPQSQAGVRVEFDEFFKIYLILMLGLLLVAWGISKVKPKEIHPAIRFLIGS